MSNIVCIGAGQTGRGYINRFFRNNRIVFLDKNKDLVKMLQNNESYTVSFGKERDSLILDNYNAYQIDTDEALDTLKEADLVMISVGQKNLKDVSSILKKSLQERKKQDIDIITCENGVNVKKELLELQNDSRVHLAEAIVFCTTLNTQGTLDILSENLDYLPYDVVSLGHELVYENMVAEKNLGVLMQRKIYTYNCTSAIVSYLGYYKGYTVYGEAANDLEIDLCIQNVVNELNKCICSEYGTDEIEQEKFSKMAIRKFQNKSIVDTIERNARDVDRKLGVHERIVAPLLIMNKYGVKCDALLLVASCAIYYGYKTNTLVKEPKEYFVSLPKEWVEQIKKFIDLLDSNVTISEILE